MRILLGGLASVFLVSCGEMSTILKPINNIISDEPVYEKPAGSNASKFFAPTAGQLTTDSKAVLEALKVGITEKAQTNLNAEFDLASDEAVVSDEAAQILEKIRAAKRALVPQDFKQIDDAVIAPQVPSLVLAAKDYTNDAVKMKVDEFTIPVLDKMPVRHQGQRGTCAAFAGIGQIEGWMLLNSSLSSIDLSEQRFYAMSKPKNWSSGGDKDAGGSNSGDGFAVSSAMKTDYDAGYPDGSNYNVPKTFNIPLETKCPYVSKVEGNDIQSPGTKEGDCATGVVYVTNFQSWNHDYKKGFDIESAQSIHDHIVDKKYPVVVSSKLSSNWEKNDGMITWADTKSAGSTKHASGHAYLVVGVRKIDEAKYPGEGGMCFVIKNSWGKGWGVNGISCMTLAWWNQHRSSGGFPLVRTASIDTQSLPTQVAQADKKPEKAAEPDATTKTTISEPKETTDTRPKGKVSFAIDPELALLADFSYAKLLNNEDEFSKILYRVDSGKIFLRGVLKGESQQTNDVELKIADDGKLWKNFEGKGDVMVGALDKAQGLIKLCSQEYSEKCDFNYVAESNELLVAITEAELLRDDSEGPYSWNYLGAGGNGIEVSIPDGFSTKLDVRFSKNGATTNPLRFRIKPLDGDILYQGVSIGNYQSGELCSGNYRSICTMVRTTEKFLVLFKSQPKES